MTVSHNPDRPTVRFPLLAGIVWSLLSLGSGCVEPFDPSSVLDDSFQVLAIRAQPRSVAPGGALEFDTIEYLPPNAPTDPEQLWVVCLPQKGEGPQACLGAALGEIGESIARCSELCAQDPDPDACGEHCSGQALEGLLCPQEESMRACIAGYGPLARYELPTWFSQERFFAFLLASVKPDGLQGCFDQWAASNSGFPAPTSECTISFKRVSVAAPDDLVASNPTVASVTLGAQTSRGEPLSLRPADLDANGRSVSLQTTTDAEADSYVSWFTNCGPLEHSRTFGPTGDNRLTIADNAPCSLFVVVRDTTYGVGWLQIDIDPTGIDIP